MTTEPEPMAYVALAPCGCIKMATVDTPERVQENAKEIAASIREGYRVERVACAWVREHFRSMCIVCRSQRRIVPAGQEVMDL